MFPSGEAVRDSKVAWGWGGGQWAVRRHGGGWGCLCVRPWPVAMRQEMPSSDRELAGGLQRGSGAQERGFLSPAREPGADGDQALGLLTVVERPSRPPADCCDPVSTQGWAQGSREGGPLTGAGVAVAAWGACRQQQ